MQIVTTETKVGLFTVSAAIVLIALFLWLNGSQLLQQGSETEAIFDRIEGLRPGAPVKYIGVDVGRVTKIYFENQKVIVVFRIKSQINLPETVEATIASAGVVGDKYLELISDPEAARIGGRIPGKSPASMEEFYDSAAEVLSSIKKITNSLSELLGDKELAGSLKDSLIRVNHLAATLDRMAANSEPRLYALLDNINRASTQLAEAGVTVNRLLNQIDDNGQTAADLRETLNHIRKVSENLDRFTKVLAENDTNINDLIKDADQTMHSINQAAQTIDHAVKSFTEDGGDVAGIRQMLDQAGDAAEKVDAYVSKLEQINVSQHIGTGYRDPEGLTVDYALTAHFNERNAMEFSFEGIGEANLASLQFSTPMANPVYRARAGLYKNEFGIGLDYLPNSRLSLGVSAWNTESLNLGLTTHWKLGEEWSLKLSTSTNIDSHEGTWDITGWYRF